MPLTYHTHALFHQQLRDQLTSYSEPAFSSWLHQHPSLHELLSFRNDFSRAYLIEHAPSLCFEHHGVFFFSSSVSFTVEQYSFFLQRIASYQPRFLSTFVSLCPPPRPLSQTVPDLFFKTHLYLHQTHQHASLSFLYSVFKDLSALASLSFGELMDQSWSYQDGAWFFHEFDTRLRPSSYLLSWIQQAPDSAITRLSQTHWPHFFIQFLKEYSLFFTPDTPLCILLFCARFNLHPLHDELSNSSFLSHKKNTPHLQVSWDHLDRFLTQYRQHQHEYQFFRELLLLSD